MSGVNAGDTPEGDWTTCCGVGGDQSATLVAPGTSATADMLNNYLKGDWDKGYMGILVRAPDGNEPGKYGGLLQGSYLHMSMKAPNSIYLGYGDIMAPTTGNCFEDDVGIYDVTDPWVYASVAAVVATRWDMNQNSADYRGNDGGEVVNVDAYYWSDSNSLDKRTDSIISNGRACHENQNFGCTDDAGCITEQDEYCKCNYDQIAPKDYGTQIANSFQLAYNPNMYGLEGNTCGMNEKQPMFTVHDYSSCWFEESDFSQANNYMSMFVDAMNSVWSARDSFWNHMLPEIYANYYIGEGYWGWNEVTVSENFNTAAFDVTDAIIVGLPAMDIVNHPDVENGNAVSLCMLSPDVLDNLSQQLANVKEFVGDKPVVILENVRGKMSAEECMGYWGNTECDQGFRKEIFAQNFLFNDGSCLIYDSDSFNLDGTADVYYKSAGDAACSGWGDKDDAWWQQNPRCN